jgi:tyrosinase
MRIRKDYRSLGAVERAEFVNALYKLKSTGVVEEFAKIHSNNFSNGIHNCSHFLPWHREMLRLFELELHKVRPGVTIPYWDSTIDTQPTDPLWNDNFLGPFNTDWKLGRELGSATLPTRQQVETNQGRDTYDRFWVELEGNIHNPPHRWVGGEMGGASSPRDPAFYLHHCWIDMLWAARWQRTHPNAPFVSSGEGYDLNDSLKEWEDRTPADVLDHHALGYTYDYELWQVVPGLAMDIGVGSNSAAWVIGTDLQKSGGYGIHRWDGEGKPWGGAAGAAMTIAVSPEGTPWIINDSGTIYRWDKGKFQPLPNAALDIGVGRNDAAWIIGTDLGIYRWNGEAWLPMVGSSVRIAVSPEGIPWVVNASGDVYRWDGKVFQPQPGVAAKDIGVGRNGTAWVIGSNKTPGGYDIYRWDADGKPWLRVVGGALRIAVSPRGTPWVVNDSGIIFRFYEEE